MFGVPGYLCPMNDEREPRFTARRRRCWQRLHPVAEWKRGVRAMDRQKCFTQKEASKMFKATSKKIGSRPGGWKAYEWRGNTGDGVKHVRASFHKDCMYFTSWTPTTTDW